MKTYIPYQQIVNKLQINKNETLLIASDITKLAYTTLTNGEIFNADLFVDSFKNKLTEGTLLFPAFNDKLMSGDKFDKKNTIPQTGTLSKLVFKRKDFSRTADPLHSFFVFGKFADELLKINNKSTFGDDSVFAFLNEHRALMLLIDIDIQHSFTFAHYVEEKENVKYRKYKKININYTDDGKAQKREVLTFAKKNGIVSTLNNLHKLFIDNGAMNIYKINDSTFSMIRLDKAYELIQEDIKMNNAENLYSFDLINFIKSSIKQFIPFK